MYCLVYGKVLVYSLEVVCWLEVTAHASRGNIRGRVHRLVYGDLGVGVLVVVSSGGHVDVYTILCNGVLEIASVDDPTGCTG